MSGHDAPMCAAMSRPVIPGKADSYFICTRDPEHSERHAPRGTHTSCDGQGHVLFAWLRMPVERYWTRDLNAHHDHGCAS